MARRPTRRRPARRPASRSEASRRSATTRSSPRSSTSRSGASSGSGAPPGRPTPSSRPAWTSCSRRCRTRACNPCRRRSRLPAMKLLAPDVSRIAPEGSEGSKDRAPDELASGTPEPLRSDLVGMLGEDRVLTRVIDLIRYASDASPYRLLPKAIVMARDAEDVGKVLAYGRRSGTPVTFRAGGTSLNGQSQSDGILVDVRRHWSGVEVLHDGTAARVKPGTVLGHANRILAPYGRKLGPDPASTDIACAGDVSAGRVRAK